MDPGDSGLQDGQGEPQEGGSALPSIINLDLYDYPHDVSATLDDLTILDDDRHIHVYDPEYQRYYCIRAKDISGSEEPFDDCS